MTEIEILAKIKQIIAKTAGLKPERMGDQASLRDELGLDSLSLMEIAFDIDVAFGLGLSDERYKDVQTLTDMVALVVDRQAELAGVERVEVGSAV